MFWIRLIGFLVLGYLPVFGGAFTDVGTWYQELEKPFFQPPSWVFGPVWSVLYIMIGLGLFAWHESLPKGRNFSGKEWGLIGAHHFLNFIWTPVFFGWHQLGLAVLVLVSLILVVGVIMYFQSQEGKVAPLLWTPYLCWISFALVLNISIWWLNESPFFSQT